MKSIIEGLEALLKGLILWARAACAPMESVRAILKQEPEERATSLTAIWIWSLVLGMVLQSPLLRLFGIELTDIGFLLPYALITSVSMFLFGSFVHLALRLFRQSSVFIDTFSIFVMTVVVYSPIWTLVSLPTLATSMFAVRTIKASNLSFEETVQRYFTEISKSPEHPTLLTAILGVVGPMALVSTLGASAVFGECIVRTYGHARFKTLLALALGSLASLVVAALTVGPLNALLLWSHVR